MKPYLKSFFLLFICAGMVVTLDQTTKILIKNSYQLYESKRLWEPFFRITFIYNEHAAFGIRIGNHLFFVIVNILASFFVLYYYFFLKHQTRSEPVALALILGGAIGNLIDRLAYHKVVDFIDVGINENWRWPVFNMADSSVTIGVGLMILSMILVKGSPRAQTHSNPSPPADSAQSGG